MEHGIPRYVLHTISKDRDALFSYLYLSHISKSGRRTRNKMCRDRELREYIGEIEITI
jgi:hypothetical protein